MTQEDYCSFEVAKLLKEKGFNWDCITYYVDSEPDDVKYSMLFENNTTWEERCCSAPTHQMAMKWLREKSIECVVIPIWNTISKQYRSYVLSDLDDKYKDNYDSYSDNISYKEAAEAVLKYSLENLI